MTHHDEKPFPTRVLVADGNQSVRDHMEAVLERLGIETMLVADAVGFVSALATDQFSIVFLDDSLPGEDPGNLVERVEQFRPDLPVVMMTSCPSIDGAVNALRYGVCDFLVKPFSLEDLESAIERAERRMRRFAQQSVVDVSVFSNQEPDSGR